MHEGVGRSAAQILGGISYARGDKWDGGDGGGLTGSVLRVYGSGERTVSC